MEALPLTPLQLLLVDRNQRVNPAGPSLLFLSYLLRDLLYLLSAAAFPGGLDVNAGGLLASEKESDTLEIARLQDLTL